MRGVLKNQQGYLKALNEVRKKSKTDASKSSAKDVKSAYNCKARIATSVGLMLNGIQGGWNIKWYVFHSVCYVNLFLIVESSLCQATHVFFNVL